MCGDTSAGADLNATCRGTVSGEAQEMAEYNHYTCNLKYDGLTLAIYQ